MIVDLHTHYAMHLLDKKRASAAAVEPLKLKRGFRQNPLNLIQRLLMMLCNNLFNFPALCDPAVTIDNLRNGRVMVALSMLYMPFDEIDLSVPYASPPLPTYFLDLNKQIDMVEHDIQNNHAETAMVAHHPSELDSAIAAKKVALIHAIEGGFHVGDTNDEIRNNVATLAGRGIAYITVAHLFFRQVATDAPAVPFLPDAVYEFICPQKPGLGLTPRGQTLIEAMVRNGILIDITHMSQKSIDDTFAFLYRTFPNQTIPVIATHSACKLDGLNFKYNIIDRHIKAVAESGGVIGLISCKHYMSEGIASPKNFDDSMKILLQHIDHIRSITDSYDNIGFGSDLDGFIKPSLPGFERPMAFAKIEDRLTTQYGSEIAANICSGNAMRVLRQVWQKPVKPLRAAAHH